MRKWNHVLDVILPSWPESEVQVRALSVFVCDHCEGDFQICSSSELEALSSGHLHLNIPATPEIELVPFLLIPPPTLLWSSSLSEPLGSI